MTALIGTLISIASLCLGAFLQYFFTRRHQLEIEARQRRAQAYADFLAGVANVAHGVTDDSQLRDQLSELAKANALVSIWAPTPVFDALVAFWSAGANTVSPEGRQAFAKLCQMMRSDCTGIEEAFDRRVRDLGIVLLGANRTAQT